ncbi:hypothetical protein JCM15519_08730 [Fundidesulfovibrio butyratiphilus]
MPGREAFKAQVEEQLKQLKAKIDATKSKADSSGQGYLQLFEEDLTKLESKYDLARYKLSLLSKGGKSAWDELKDGVERAVADLREALGKAKEKF